MVKFLVGGKKHRGALAELIMNYEKRLKKPFELQWEFVDEAKLEGKILALATEKFVVLLDERGKSLSSVALSELLGEKLEMGREVVFVIGGAFGHFSDVVLTRADMRLSLSKMVLPHQICRLILAEQIYRAQEIYLGHPYHHA